MKSFCLIFLFTLISCPLWAADFSVLPDGDDDCSDLQCSLHAALQTASLNGTVDTLYLAAGTYQYTTTLLEYKPTVGDPSLSLVGSGVGNTLIGGFGVDLDFTGSAINAVSITFKDFEVGGILKILAPDAYISLGSLKAGEINLYGNGLETESNASISADLLILHGQGGIPYNYYPVEGGSVTLCANSTACQGNDSGEGSEEVGMIQVGNGSVTIIANPPGVDVVNPGGIDLIDPGGISITLMILGDVNDDKNVDLADAICALQVRTLHMAACSPKFYNDVNNDYQIGLPEAIFALQVSANIRQLP